MRHLWSGRKLNRTAAHRKAMLSNLAVSLLDKERVTTTGAKAKEVRSVVERLITYGKKGTLHAIRLAARKINDKDVLKKLFDDIAPGYKDREGGYTRVIKLKERKGDNAEMSIIELVGRAGDEPRRRKKKKKAATKKTKAVDKSTQDEISEVQEKSKESVAEKSKEKVSVDKKMEDKKGKKATKTETKKTTTPKAKKTTETKAKKKAETKTKENQRNKSKKE